MVPLHMAVAMAVQPEMFEETLSDIAELLAAEAWADAVRLGFINEKEHNENPAPDSGAFGLDAYGRLGDQSTGAVSY